MTSGIIESYHVSDIVVLPSRQRKELGDIQELANSIATHGLMNPIIIRRNGELVAGERRLRAVKSLGWDMVLVHYIDELSAEDAFAIELEENIKRKALTWDEEVAAIAKYHAMQQNLHPDWTQDKTAEAIGVAPSTAHKALLVAREIETGNVQVKEAPKFSVALGLATRAVERRKSDELSTITPENRPAATVSKGGTTGADVIKTASFLDWAPDYTGPKFNLLHCDFPYGVNADAIQQGTAVAMHGGYADTPEVYFTLLETLAKYLDNFCTPSAHMVFWHSWKHHTATKEFLRKNTDFKVNDYPLIWHKTDNAGVLPDPRRGPRNINEVALFCTRGDRFIVSAVGNTYGAPTARDIHMSVKPEPMLRHFLSMLVDDSTSMLDPTCGSGSSLRAAHSLKARRVLGLEINDTFATDARKKFDEFLALRKLSGD